MAINKGVSNTSLLKCQLNTVKKDISKVTVKVHNLSKLSKVLDKEANSFTNVISQWSI